MKGLVSVLFSDNFDVVSKGVEVLARSFMARLNRNQRYECIRDAGYGLVIGFNKLKIHLDTAHALQSIMDITSDGTSYIWPTIES